MGYTLLLYGATGYSGRLIAAEAARRAMADAASGAEYRMVLAGRDRRAVAAMAAEHAMEARAFTIADRDQVVQALADVDVLINAAGPFATTADYLARGALAGNCHYVDINGEAEVYMRIDDLGHGAVERRLAMVCGAGHTAAASDVLLDVALQALRNASPGEQDIELGAVRIAVSRIQSLSRGSLQTLSRSAREQVRTVRMGLVVDDDGVEKREQVLWYEPVGKLERTFDFFDPRAVDVGQPSGARARDGRNVQIASAANLVDTLTARLTVDRHGFTARRIESYVEASVVARLAYQVAPLLAPVLALPWARDLARLQANALPDGPAEADRRRETNFLVLEIEDLFRAPAIHWGWHTPNPYDFTAQVVVEIARRVAQGGHEGWLTPAQVLCPAKAQLSGAGPYSGCALIERRSPAPKRAS